MFKGFTEVTPPASVTITSTIGHGGGGTLAKLIDDDLSGPVNWWSQASAESAGFEIKYDWGVGSSEEPDSFQTWVNYNNGSPLVYTWEWSDDDAAWTPITTGAVAPGQALGSLGPRTLFTGGVAIDFIYPVGFLIGMKKRTGKNFDVTPTLTISLFKGFFVELDASTAATVAYVKAITHGMVAGATHAVGIVKQHTRSISINATAAVTFAKDYAKILAATVTGAATLWKGRFLSLATTVAGAVTEVLRRGAFLGVTVAGVAQMVLARLGFQLGDDTVTVQNRPTEAKITKKATTVTVVKPRSQW